LVWHNQSPELYAERGEQEKPTEAQVAAYPEGGGGGNVRTFFCSADGNVVTYLEGFWQPASFLREAKAVDEVCQAVSAAAVGERARIVAEHLAARRRDLAFERSAVLRAMAEKHRRGIVEELEVVRVEAPYGLLDRSLAASEEMAKRPVGVILSELEARNRFHGVIV
jgi:hypothetical protein